MGRKKLERQHLHARVATTTPAKLKQIALLLGFEYGGDGAVGQLLDAIADAKIELRRKSG